jgi:chemotaxis protein MotB
MYRRIVSLLILALPACGVPREAFQAQVMEAERAAQRAREQAEKSSALEQKLGEVQKQLEAEAARAAVAEQRANAIEQQLMNKEAERRGLQEQNAQLSALNDELSRSKKKLVEAKAELEKKSSEYEALAQSLKGEIDAGKVELSELRGRMTVKLKDKILFASGSSRVGKEGQEALAKVAAALQTVKGRIIRVEGHTDDVPTDRTSAFTNWDLSVARAVAVVQQLQLHGVDPTKLSAAGYGQFQPIVPNVSQENRSLNRRIEIVLAAPLAPSAATNASSR